MRRIAAFVLVAFAAVPAVAIAHEGNPNYESRVRSVSPDAKGVRVQVVNYDDSLELVNSSGKDVTIDGYDGEPYARVLADGTVQVNERSPARFLNDDRFAAVDVPKSADAKAKPEWKTMDETGRFTWHDHRIHWMSSAADPPQLTDKAKRTKIFDWKVPVAVAGTPTTISGDLYWKPTEDSGGLPVGAIIAFALLVVGGIAFVVIVRRRRARGDGGGEDGGDGGAGDGGAAAKPAAGEAW